MSRDPLYVLTVLCLCVAVADWLARRTLLRHAGTAVIAILLAAVAANLELIPSASDAIPLYGGLFSYLAPFAIFVLLLEVQLRGLRRAGLPLLGLFLAGSAATVIGVLAAGWLVGAGEAFGARQPALAGMFVATYTGGALNFNAVALHYDVVADGLLYTGALAVDNLMSALWVAVTLALPIVLQRLWPRVESAPLEEAVADRSAAEGERVTAGGLTALLLLGVSALWLAERISAWFATRDIVVPAILLVTSFALVLAQTRLTRDSGRRTIGLYSVYLFLATIGAHAELAALAEIGRIGLLLLAYVSIAILIHGLILFALGGLLGSDWRLVAIASQANVGGATTALALAESFSRRDLLLPAVLIGSLGNALGTYLGFAVAAALGV